MKKESAGNINLILWIFSIILLLLAYLSPEDAFFQDAGLNVKYSHALSGFYFMCLLLLAHKRLVSWETTSDYIVMFFIVLFLFSHFTADLMLSKTTTTGGDMGSDNYLAKYLKEYLIPHGKLIGWCPGRWLGFPIFQFQFILPYLFMVSMSYFIPLEIAFKIVTVSGVFTLPLFTYLAVRYIGFRFPTPIIAAIFSLHFLFQEKNTVFGGNIPSVLAGEFSYSISFAFMVLFLGVLYRSIENGRFSLSSVILFVFMALSHACTTITAVLISVYFLLDLNKSRFTQNFKILFKTYALSFLLLAFFLLPLAAKLQYSSDYGGDWAVNQLFDWYQMPDAYLFHSLALIGFVYALIAASFIRNKNSEGQSGTELKQIVLRAVLFLIWISSALYQIFSGFNEILSGIFIGSGILLAFFIDRKAGFLFFAFIISLFAFFNGETLKTANVRFFPMLYFFALLLAAYPLGEFAAKLKGRWVIPIILVLWATSWISSPFPPDDMRKDLKGIPQLNSPTAFIDGWIKHNYEGFESKGIKGDEQRYWKQYKGIMDLVSGTPGRLHNDLSDDNNRFGTPRAFESTPYFSDKPTLEGVYAQAALCSPYVSYFQCEMSHHCAGIPRVEGEERTTGFNVEAGTKHAKVINVKDYVAVYDKLKEELMENPEWESIGVFGDHEVFNLVTIDGSYVEVPEYEPVLVEANQWRGLSLEWYTNLDNIDVPLVFVKSADEAGRERFKTIVSDEGKAQLMLRKSLLKPEYMNEWLVCGPFPNPRDRPLRDEDYWETSLDHGLEIDYIGEATVSPDLDGECAGKRWFSQLANSRGYLDLNLKMKPNDEVVAYAHTYVYSPVDRDVNMLYGSDDGIKIWVNGELLSTDHAHRPATVDGNTLPVSLRKGWNNILLKVEDVTGGWGFYARLTDAEGKTLSDLHYQSEKPKPGEVPAEDGDDTGLKRILLDNECWITENVLNEEIKFTTSCVGKPHIIKMSYFPNWKVEGADRIYIVSPAFMLVYPSQENVRLYYADTPVDIVGNFLSIIGLLILACLVLDNLRKRTSSR
ncbi:MAG: hypothetical protein JW724_00015 [Candidatus Altiarchaeota archaeon]|nr:hypothetical protein [Candidatus Altiarchaeota archaeon]